MAWDIAAYVIAITVLAVAGVMTAAIFHLIRSLRRWDRMAIRLSLKADAAFDEYVRLAQEAREAAQLWRQTLSGFSRLAEGARAAGEAAESAVQAVVNAASYWQGRLTFRQQREEAGASSESVTDLPGLARHLWHYVRSRRPEEPPAGGRHPGTSADPHSGE